MTDTIATASSDPEIPAQFLEPLPPPDDAGLASAERRLKALSEWIERPEPSDALRDRLYDLSDTLKDFIADAPALTAAGIAVKLRVLEMVEHPWTTTRWASALVATSLAGLERRRCAGAEADPSADAALEALGEQAVALESTREPDGSSREESDRRTDERADRITAIERTIAGTAAATVKGVLVKAKIAAAEHDNDQMLASLVRDLERLAGGAQS